MSINTVHALLARAPEPPALRADLPNLQTVQGRQELALYRDAHGYGAVLVLCDQHLHEQPGDVDVLVLQTEALVHLGRFEDARRSSLAALVAAPHRADVRALRKLVTLEDFSPGADGDAGQSAQNPETGAQTTGPAHGVEATVAAARAKDLYLRGDGGALAEANRAVTRNPHNVWARMVQAEIVAQLQGPKAAATAAAAFEELAPKSPAAMWCVIRSQAQPCQTWEEQAASLDYLNRMERLAPGSAWGAMAAAHLGACGAYRAAGAGHEAWPVREGPMLSMVLAQARAQAARGTPREALSTLEPAAQHFPDAYGVRALRAELFLACQDRAQTVRSLESARALGRGDQYVEASVQLAALALERSELGQAEAFLQEALQVAPRNGEALLMLAQVLLLGVPEAEDRDALHQRIVMLAERALLCEPVYHPQAHYLIGLSGANVPEAGRHLRRAMEGFKEDPARVLEAQNALVCRLVENGDYGEAQHVLDTVSEEMWPRLMRDASDAKKGVEAFRARRLGEATVASSRQALYAKNFVQAITEIEEITDNPDVQHDAELFATLMGIKALAYLEMDLHSDARRAASRALDIARGNAIVKAMTEAHLVKRQLDEHAKRERKKWVLDIVNRYLWLIVGASGAGSIYSLGMSFIRTLRGAFYNPNARAGAALPPPPPAEHRNEATP